MKSGDERRAEFERREEIRKAKYVAARERNRARSEELDRKQAELKEQRAEARVTAGVRPKYPVPPSMLELVTLVGTARYIREGQVYSAAYRDQQRRIQAGEVIPEDELLPAWNPPQFGG